MRNDREQTFNTIQIIEEPIFLKRVEVYWQIAVSSV